MDQKKRTDISANPSQAKSNSNTTTPRRTKNEACLLLLLRRKETHHFNAAKSYHESCLNTTVSKLQSEQGIMVARTYRPLPNAMTNVPFAHYFLTGDNRIKAMKLVDKLRVKRNAEPMNWEGFA